MFLLMPSDGEFPSRVALVTGGGRGIGRASALRFGKDGTAVVVADIDPEPAREVADEIREAGGRALSVSCDVRDSASVEAAVSAAVSEFGSLDFLATCAGVLRDNLIHKMTEEDWDMVIGTHLKGAFLCARAAQAVMVPKHFGRMVFLSSGAARGNRGQTNYSAAKAGLLGIVRTLAIELGRYDIRVNAVAPGFVETRMTRSVAERTGVDYEELKRATAERLALRRIGQPEEIAGVIAFLCGEDSSFVTGQTLYARGAP
jgi:3-oxoacyl-[acyl-carrier protein] reductase